MLKQTVYSSLIVSDSDKFNEAIKDFLPKAMYNPVVFAGSQEEARRLLNERFFDLVLINAPVKEELCFDLAIELSEQTECGIMFSASEMLLSDIKHHLVDRGVLVLSRPASQKIIQAALSDLCSLRNRLKKYEQKAESLEHKMQEIRHVNQAKLLLIEKQSMTESEAHHYIEKESMTSHQKRDVIALQIIARLA